MFLGINLTLESVELCEQVKSFHDKQRHASISKKIDNKSIENCMTQKVVLKLNLTIIFVGGITKDHESDCCLIRILLFVCVDIVIKLFSYFVVMIFFQNKPSICYFSKASNR